MPAKHKRTTYTTLALEYLRKLDDFARPVQIAIAIGCAKSSVSKTLDHLRRHHCIDCVEVHGKLYFYALPSGDTRLFCVEERAIEKGRKRSTKPRFKKARITDDDFSLGGPRS